ncbi:MAG: RagB/SusD family nutrient uptake outer membrane protein [Odoribacteraceae bacterium]|jgi:tetratricopeptide (TPR) repeat protein|nr:RagB/SusD family nutrient uptake outer membrane protein [Odoribacteraceae bacterium]
MKRIYLILSLVLSMMASACNEWLDMPSNEYIFEDEAFSSNRGFRSALVGTYRLVGSENLWGRELTWGFLSVIGRNYNPSMLPTQYRQAITDEDYENPAYVKPILDSIWKTGYNVIANCNNILKNIDNLEDAAFEYPWEKEMITAEAKALRALMHFELMRLFVPAPITGFTGKAIPYSETHPDVHPGYKTMEEIFERVIADLKEAKEVLKRVDVDILWEPTIMNYISTPLFYGIQNLREDGTYGNGLGFFSFRGFRMNYWGVTALLGRVYSYKRDNATAVQYINELLDEWEGEDDIGWGWYQYNSNPNSISGKRIPEPVISFWNTQAYTIYENALKALTNSFRMISLTELFKGDEEDYRYKGLYNTLTQRYRVWERPTDPAYSFSLTSSSVLYGGPLLPVLELPELYYIRCEYLAEQGRIDEAIAMLKTVKDNRNITSAIVANDYDSFMRVLIKDATRDFLTRGQTWHYLKKLNWKEMYNGTTVPWTAPDSWYVLPIPDSEINFN